MVAFYNEQDQNIYDNVSKFMPMSKYLRSAPTFTAPTTEEEEITETFGIPNTNAFTNSRGDNYTGSYNFTISHTVDNAVNDAYRGFGTCASISNDGSTIAIGIVSHDGTYTNGGNVALYTI